MRPTSGLLSSPRPLLTLLSIPIVLGCLAALVPAFANPDPATGIPRAFVELAQSPGILRSVAVSLLSGLVTPALSLAIVFGFLAASQGKRIGRRAARLSAPVLALPHAAAAFGLALLVAPTGVLSRVLSTALGWETPPDALLVNHPLGLTLILGLVLKEAPFLLLVSLAAAPALDPPRRVALARTLGYGPLGAWFLTVAPALYARIRLPLFAVILFASSAVDVALILGPSLPPTLSVRLLEWHTSTQLDQRDLAAAAGLLQLGTSLGALALWLLLERAASRLYRGQLGRGSPAARHSRGERFIAALGLGALPAALLITLGGLLALLVASLADGWRYPALLPDRWSVEGWVGAAAGLATPLGNAIAVAACAVCVALAVSLLILETQTRAQRSALDKVLYLPLLLPQVVFLSGLVTLAEWFTLTPSLGLVVLGHCFFVLPYVYLTLHAAYSTRDERWLMRAATRGLRRRARFLRVRLPLLSASLITAAMLGLVISLSLYLPTQLLGAGRVPTLTTEAVALVSSGDRRAIAVWALLQSFLPMLCFALALGLPRLLWTRRKGMLGGL